MDVKIKCLIEMSYKGHIISKLEDTFGQAFVRIDDIKEPDYASIADAKRVINGKCPKWVNDGYTWDEAKKKLIKE